MSWESISRAELDELIAAEVALLDPEALAVYVRFRVEPQIIQRVFARDPSAPEPSYVIARSGPHVLFYDDIEGEWGTAVLAEDGKVYDWGTWGNPLRRALLNFPFPAALRRSD